MVGGHGASTVVWVNQQLGWCDGHSMNHLSLLQDLVNFFHLLVDAFAGSNGLGSMWWVKPWLSSACVQVFGGYTWACFVLEFAYTWLQMCAKCIWL